MNSVQHLARLLQQSHDGAAPELVEYLKVSTSSLLTSDRTDFFMKLLKAE